MRFDWYDADNQTLATDIDGNVLSGKAIQSWYNPFDVDSKIKGGRPDFWDDVSFDWIWGVPTVKEVAGNIKTNAIETVEGVKNIIPKTAGYFMTALVLVAVIVIVPRVFAVRS